MQSPAPHPHRHARAEVTLAPSLLRLSAMQRFAVAVVLAAFLWTAVFWALMEISA